jgi:DNA-binding transcriptional LysR family regulator
MSLSILRTFVEVYRQKSLTAAAKALSLTQPAVSQHLVSLETMLTRRLFERSRRGVAALPAADELYAMLGDSLDRAEAALAAVRARAPGVSGVVRIAGPAEYIGEQFTDRLSKLAASGLDLRISTGNRDAIYAELLSGDVDLAITASMPDHKMLGVAQIAEERLILVHSISRDKLSDVTALIGSQTYCAYDVDLPLIRQWCDANGIARPPHLPHVVLPNLRGLLNFVISGAGWSVLPDYICKAAIIAGQVRQWKAVEPTNQLYLVWMKGQLRHPRVAHAHRFLLT